MGWDGVNRGDMKPLEGIRSVALEMDGGNQREIVVGENGSSLIENRWWKMNIGHTTTRAERLQTSFSKIQDGKQVKSQATPRLFHRQKFQVLPSTEKILNENGKRSVEEADIEK